MKKAQYRMNFSPVKYWASVSFLRRENHCKYVAKICTKYTGGSVQGDSIRSVGKTSSLVEIRREEECRSVYTKYQIIS